MVRTGSCVSKIVFISLKVYTYCKHFVYVSRTQKLNEATHAVEKSSPMGKKIK